MSNEFRPWRIRAHRAPLSRSFPPELRQGAGQTEAEHVKLVSQTLNSKLWFGRVLTLLTMCQSQWRS